MVPTDDAPRRCPRPRRGCIRAGLRARTAPPSVVDRPLPAWRWLHSSACSDIRPPPSAPSSRPSMPPAHANCHPVAYRTTSRSRVCGTGCGSHALLMSPGGRTSASIRWWTELSTHLVGSGLRIAVLGQLPADLLEALQAAKPKLDVHPSTLPKQSAFELVLCGVDLPLAEGAAAFGALRELGSRALLVSTPEDQRDEQLVAPRLDEWVTWFAARGHLRDFRRDAITATGCVPLRHDVEPGAVLGAYERQLEQREARVQRDPRRRRAVPWRARRARARDRSPALPHRRAAERGESDGSGDRIGCSATAGRLDAAARAQYFRRAARRRAAPRDHPPALRPRVEHSRTHVSTGASPTPCVRRRRCSGRSTRATRSSEPVGCGWRSSGPGHGADDEPQATRSRDVRIFA